MTTMNIWRKYLVLVGVVGLLSQQQRTPQEILSDFDRLVVEMRAALTPPQPDPAVPIQVEATANLQDAINAAPVGAILELPSGATYTGNFRATKAVTIRTRGVQLPECAPDAPHCAPDEAQCAQMARIVTPNNAPAFAVVPGTNDVQLQKVAFDGPGNEVILLGTDDTLQATPDRAPRRITVEQSCISGASKFGISLQSAETTIRRNFIRDVARDGQESKTIAGWNTPGQILIERNHLLGSTIGILFGGDQPTIPQNVAADIRIVGNLIEKHRDWQTRNYAPKNAIECKACRRATISGNVIDYMPAGGQAGFAIVFTPSQYGGEPWAIVEDVVVEHNVARQVGGVFNILGHGQNQTTAGRATLVTRNVTVRDNWFQCDRNLGGHGALASFGNGPINIVFDQNTIECNGDAFLRKSDAVAMPGFRYTGNLQVVTGTYGIYIAGGLSRFSAAVMAQLPGAVINGNAFVGANSTIRANLPTNLYIATGEDLIVNGYGINAANGYGRRR